MWPCISASPGIRYLPWPSTRVAPSGIGVAFAGPSAVIRSPVMTTVWFGRTWLPFIGTTDTFANATLFGGCAPACIEASGTITAASRAHPTTDMAFPPTSACLAQARRVKAGPTLDIGAHDGIEVLILRKSELTGPARIQRSRPRVDQLCDARITLPADARSRVGAGDPFEGRGHLADRDRQARQADRSVGAESIGRKIVRVNEAADGALRRDHPHARRAIDRADGLLPVHR